MKAVRILGIDPGLRRTGWGVIEAAGNTLSFVACGSVVSDERLDVARRLNTLYGGLVAVVEIYRPNEAAVEDTYVNADPRSALRLGQARGVALFVPSQAGLPVSEYAPSVVKKSVVGNGHGEKGQVRMMIRALLPKAKPESEDAADALAVAITHAHHRNAPVLRLAAGARM